MKVLIIHTQMKFVGGAELLIIELANQLTKKGIKNDILALSSSKEVEEKLTNTKIIIPENNINLEPPGFKSAKEIIDFIKIFRKKLKQIVNNYDVINFHNFPVTWTLWPRKKPCVWMLNEPPNLWSKPNANWKLKLLNKLRIKADRFFVRHSIDLICVADEFNEKRCKERYGLDSKIIYYGVNYDFFSKGNEKNAIEKLNLKNKFIIVQSGMLTEAKNQLESIKAINKIKDKIPNLLLVLAGKEDLDYKKKLEEYINKNNLGKNILFTGNLNREDLRDLYKAGDIGIFPVGQQGGWLAPFEMLCSGKPIIVSEEMGAASVIKENNLGIVTSDYAKAIENIYKDNSYKKTAEKAKIFIKNNLSWKVFTEKLIESYKDALKMHKTNSS